MSAAIVLIKNAVIMITAKDWVLEVVFARELELEQHRWDCWARWQVQ